MKNNKNNNENKEETSKKRTFGPKYISHLPSPGIAKGIWKNTIHEMKNSKSSKYQIEKQEEKMKNGGYPKLDVKKRTITIKSKNNEISTFHYKTLADCMVPARGRKRIKNVRMPTTKGRK